MIFSNWKGGGDFIRGLGLITHHSKWTMGTRALLLVSQLMLSGLSPVACHRYNHHFDESGLVKSDYFKSFSLSLSYNTFYKDGLERAKWVKIQNVCQGCRGLILNNSELQRWAVNFFLKPRSLQGIDIQGCSFSPLKTDYFRLMLNQDSYHVMFSILRKKSVSSVTNLAVAYILILTVWKSKLQKTWHLSALR